MENCGLNKRLSDSGIHSPLVVGKIIEGKNMKRCFSYNSEYKEKEIVGPILNIIQIGLEYVPTCHNQLIEELTLANLFSKFQSFREDLQKQGKFLNKLSWK